MSILDYISKVNTLQNNTRVCPLHLHYHIGLDLHILRVNENKIYVNYDKMGHSHKSHRTD